MKPCILITGATAGIGLATAELLHTKGCKVFASGRNRDKLTELNSTGLSAVYLDVTHVDSCRDALAEIQSQGFWVQTLINNAGYGQFGAFEDIDDATARAQFDTNVFGLSNITRLVIPAMRENHSGRIVNLSSIAGKVSMPVGGWYAASKFAIEALSDAMRWELKDFGIKVVIIEPGPIKSEFGKTANRMIEKLNSKGYYDKFYGFVRNFDSQFNIGGTSEHGAKIIVRAATVRRPCIRYRVTAAAKLIYAMRLMLCDRLFDAGMMKYFKHS